MDERRHASFTGTFAQIEDKEGSSFSLYDGYITGKNIVLERGKKIVQTWKAKEEHWPDDHFSEAAFILSEHPDGCEVQLFHTAVPEEYAEAIEEGWLTYYWEPMKYYIER